MSAKSLHLNDRFPISPFLANFQFVGNSLDGLELRLDLDTFFLEIAAAFFRDSAIERNKLPKSFLI